MLFFTPTFVLAFLPLALLAFWLARTKSLRAGVFVLLVASIIFLGWRTRFDVAVFALSLGGNYVVSEALGRRRSKAMLGAGVAGNLLLLGYFKYLAFISANLGAPVGPVQSTALPLAISFYTFNQIGYLIARYRREVLAHEFLDYALFVSFFPHLIAGPIVHYQQLAVQFRSPALMRLSTRNFAVGITIFVAGMFKKIVMADALAGYADPLFAKAATGAPVSFLEAWGGDLAYGFQIYFDFSAYSDMAIGLAALFGVALPINFFSPYKATSVIEFWHRWHITLSRFLRDYLYIPLGGSRRGTARKYTNLMITMILGGIWHGAGWTFLLWGAVHGVLLVINHFWRALWHRGKPPAAGGTGRLALAVKWLVTFVVVQVAWVLFRAQSLAAAANIYQGMIGWDGRFILPPSYVALFSKVPFLGELSAAISSKWNADNAFAGGDQLVTLAAAFAMTLALPNVKEWMGGYFPTFPKEPVAGEAARWQWNAQKSVAVLCGAVFLITLGMQVFVRTPPQFIYFEF
jgi:D-alanyl-lipoteichoic acid acyltransferase DltB (MBOAT superfamily)